MASQAILVAASAATSFLIMRYLLQFTIRDSHTWTLLTICILLVITRWIVTIVIYPHFLSPLRNLPTPPGGRFLMGHSLQLFDSPIGGPQREWLNIIPNDGVIYYRVSWNAARVMPTTPQALSEVLVSKSYEIIKPQQSRDFLAPVLGIGLLLAEGDEHKRQRKALMPAFQYRHIKNLYPVFWNEASRMVEAIAKEIKGSQSQVSISDWVTRATLDIIGTAGLGQSFCALEDPNNELHQAYKRVFSPKSMPKTLHYLRFILPLKLFRKLPVRQNYDAVKAIRVIRSSARDMIRSKKIQLEATKSPGSNILSVALSSGDFGEDDLVNQLMTFLAAGHETTAASMMWAAYLLCRHPDIQKRLRNEIREKLPPITGIKESNVSAGHFDNMPYLNAVCNEVLRLYPPVPHVLRGASKDTNIAGHFIPKDTIIILPIWAINNNKALWGSDAGEFNPERWLAPGQANSGGSDSNFANMTFLHGPRSCIGQAFAKAEFQCLLACLLGRLELMPVPGDDVLGIVGDLTNKPKGGTWALMRELEGW